MTSTPNQIIEALRKIYGASALANLRSELRVKVMFEASGITLTRYRSH